MTDTGIDSPPHEDKLDELNPFAVEARYGMTDPGRIDRDATTLMVGALLVWAEGQLSKPSSPVEGR